MFSQKKIQFAGKIMLILIGLFAVTQVGFAMPIVIGGVILQGILGGFSGKVGPVVGGKWKDISYMRGYVVPANPNTAGQQAVRAKFAALVAFGRSILTTVLQVYWDPFISTMSGFNDFISKNYALSSVEGLLDETAIISHGTLTGVPLVTGTYDTSIGELIVGWQTALEGNAEATDEIVVVAWDKTTNAFLVVKSAGARSTATENMSIKTGLTATNIVAAVFAHRGTGSEFIVSDNVNDVCAAP